MKTWLVWSSLSLAIASAGAADIYKWTDARGVTHYGDQPPSQATKSVRLEVKDTLTAEERAAVQARLAAERAGLPASAPDQPAALPRPAGAATGTAPATTDCARQWRAYNDAVRCQDPLHRYAADRAAHPEHYQQCPREFKEVQAPVCAEPVR